MVGLFFNDSTKTSFIDTPSLSKRSLLQDDEASEQMCHDIHTYSKDQRCTVAAQDCQPEGYINYYKFHYCYCMNYSYLSFIVLVRISDFTYR
jgi:hypothetical protein